MPQSAFWSIAFADIPAPDYADAIIGVLPDGAPLDPADWARTLFSIAAMPRWVAAAMGVRQLLVPVLGIPRAPRGAFAVRRVEGGEALLGFDDMHLDFRVAVGVDQATRLVRIVTAVRLKGWRGRLYFAPVRLGHPAVVQAMLRRSQRLLAGESPTVGASKLSTDA
jgi:hypothetical protein